MTLRLPGMGDAPTVRSKPLSGGDEPTMSSELPDDSGRASDDGALAAELTSRSIDSSGPVDAPNPKAALFRGLASLVIIIAISGGGLAAMRSMGTKGLLAFDDDIKIDYEVDNTDVVKSDHDGLIEDLRGADEFDQVPLSMVRMNPFTLREQATKSAETVTDYMPQREDPQVVRRRELERMVESLRLNSVLNGSVPVAQVSGNVVRVGDLVNDVFRVRTIQTGQVELEAEGMTFVLVRVD